MARQMPPLAWLRAFEAAARHLSFTRAATELRLTQTAVSKQVKLLEQHLGEALFLRKPRSLVLTQLGASYLPKLKDTFARLAAVTDEVFGDRRRNIVTLRASIGFSVNWLAPRLMAFADQFPDITVRLISSVWGEEFDRERLDLDIQYGTGHWPGFHADPLTKDRLFPVCAPSLLKDGLSLEHPSDLARYRLLHVLGYEAGWADWFSAAGVETTTPGVGMQFDTSLMSFAFAAIGGGVALAQSSLVENELKSGKLIKPFEIEIMASDRFFLLSPVDGQRNQSAEVFRSWLISNVQAV